MANFKALDQKVISLDIKTNKTKTEYFTKYAPIHMTDYSSAYVFKDSSNPLSRIMQHIQENGCMIISAERSERSEEENIRKTQELENDIRSYNLGYRPSLGGFIENKGTDEERAVSGELSFIVAKPLSMGDAEFLKIAVELGKKYDQESVTVALKSLNNGRPSWVNTSTDPYDIDMDFDGVRQTRTEGEDKDEYFTKTKRQGKSFTLYNTSDSIKRDINGNEYRIATDGGCDLEDLISRYTNTQLMRPFHMTKRFTKGYQFDDSTGFFEKK